MQLVVVSLYTKFEVSILNSCGDIFDATIWRERKKNKFREEQIGEGQFFNPAIQLVVVNLYTKFEVSIFKGCRDIFDEKFGKKEKGTNKRKNK